MFIPQLPDDPASQKLMAGHRVSLQQTPGGATPIGPLNQSQHNLNQADDSVFETTNNNSRVPLRLHNTNTNQLQDFSD